MKHYRRFLSILLALVLLMGVLPAQALAQTAELPADESAAEPQNPQVETMEETAPEEEPAEETQPGEETAEVEVTAPPAESVDVQEENTVLTSLDLVHGAAERSLFSHLRDSDATAVEFQVPHRNASIQFVEMDNALKYMEERMIARASAVKVMIITDYEYGLTNEKVEQLWLDVLYAALQLDRNPAGGDYLAMHLAGASGTYAYDNSDYRNLYFIFTYQLTYLTTFGQENEVEHAIYRCFNAYNLGTKSEYEAARLIYDYVVSNVEYDQAGLHDPEDVMKYTGYGAIVEGSAVCQGYSVLFYRMAKYCGLDVRLIPGETQGCDNPAGHAWNIVKIGEKYYNIDTCLEHRTPDDSGSVYFLKTQGEFPNHSRAIAYDTKEFHKEYPMATEEPEKLIIGKGTCGENVSWVLTGNGVLTISGTGDTEEEFVPGFYRYRKIIGEIILEEGITSLGKDMFASCYCFDDIQIPSTVTKIGSGAFYDCKGLESIVIPESVTEMGSAVFENCTSLKKAVLPRNLQEMKQKMFYKCDALTEVRLPENLTSIPANTFYSCGLTSFSFPDSITVIEDGAFYGCQIDNLVLPDGLTTIGADAFAYNGSLKILNLPDSVTEIGDKAFDTCRNLSKINFSDNLKSIGTQCFQECESMVWLILPESLESIGTHAFYACDNLEYLYVPALVTGDIWMNIDHVLYGGTREQWESRFDTYGFATHYEASPEDLITSFESFCTIRPLCQCGICRQVAQDEFYKGSHSFQGDSCAKCGASKYFQYEMDQYQDYLNITDYTGTDETLEIPGTIEGIAVGCIEDSVFYGNTQLKHVTVSEGIQYIDGRVFQECTALETVRLPASLREVRGWAFTDCTALKGVYISDILAWNKVDFTLEDSNPLYYAGNLYLNDVLVTELTIPEGAERIGDYAFVGCTLSSVSLPESVTELGQGAFSYCKNLEKINIPNGVRTLPMSLFSSCKSLKQIRIPDGVGSIDYAAFSWTGIQEIVIPDSVTDIDFFAFQNCTQLKSVTLSENVTTIFNGAFAGCTALEVIRIPAKVKDIRAVVFKDCTNLRKIIFTGNRPNNIAQDAFEGVTADALYPVDNSTWDGVTMGNYGGTLNWIPYDPAQKFELYGSSMTLGNALDMNFFVYQYNIEGTGNYAIITKHYADGREDAVVRVEQENWNSLGSAYYYFTFSGVKAKEMADKVDVVIYNADGEAISEVFTDSVQGYARRMLDNPETSATHRTLYIEMLNYGAAAQVEFKYDVNNLANSVITEEEQTAYGMKDRTYVNQRQSDAAYFGTTLTLENQIVFNIFYNGSYVPEGAYAVATFVNHKGEAIEETVTSFEKLANYQYASFKSLVVADCSELITVTLYNGEGNVISTVTDSIEGYAARMTEVGPLYDAIMKFADAAYQYFHS